MKATSILFIQIKICTSSIACMRHHGVDTRGSIRKWLSNSWLTLTFFELKPLQTCTLNLVPYQTFLLPSIGNDIQKRNSVGVLHGTKVGSPFLAPCHVLALIAIERWKC
jgi:hypothetical protein